MRTETLGKLINTVVVPQVNSRESGARKLFWEKARFYANKLFYCALLVKNGYAYLQFLLKQQNDSKISSNFFWGKSVSTRNRKVEKRRFIV